MSNSLSIIMYTSSIFTSIFSSYKLNKDCSSKYKPLYFILIIFSLSILPGLRGSMVGIDTENYLNMIWYMINENNVWLSNEPGLFVVAKLSSLISMNLNFVLFVCSLFINGFLYVGLWKLREKISVTFSLYMYIIFFYLETFNIMRQWMSVSLVIFSISFLISNQMVKYLVTIIAATLFHNTAIISILFVPIYYILSNDVNYATTLKKIDFKKVVSILLILTVLFLVLQTRLNVFDKYYNIFLSVERTNTKGILGIVRLFLSVAYYICYRIYFKSDNKESKIVFTFYLIITIIEIPFYTFKVLMRTILVFSACKTLIYGYIFKIRNDYPILNYVLICSVILNTMVFLQLLLKGRGILPYMFFWQ